MNKSTLNLIGYYIAFISIGIVASSLGPTLPDLMAQTGSNIGQIGFLLAMRPIGYLIGSVVVGRLYDRFAGHPIMVVAAGMLVVGMFMIPLTPLLWLLGAIMLFVGIGEAGVDVGGNTLIVWTYAEKVGPYMNGLHFMFGLGAFIAPLVVAVALSLTGGIAWAYWVLAALIVPSIIWLSRVPSPAIRVVKNVEQTGRVDYLLVGLLATFFFLYAGAEISFGAWLSTYSQTLGLATDTVAAYLTSAFWGSFTVGRLISIPLAARVRPRTLLGGSLIGSLIGIGLPLFAPSAVTVWAGAIFTGLAMAAIFPTLLSFAERRLTLTGQITSVFFIGASLGGMTTPWLIGQLFERTGPGATMLVIFSELVISVFVFGALMVLKPQPKPAIS